MKKNYLLLFLIALLFGFGTLPGRAEDFSYDVTEEYHFKIGNGYIKVNDIAKEDIVCVEDKSQATPIKFGSSSSGVNISFGSYINNKFMSFKYDQTGFLGLFWGDKKFECVTISGKYYIKTKLYGLGYLTNENGKLVFKKEPTPDAVFEFKNKNGSSEEVILNAIKMRETLALFQAKRAGIGHSPNEFFGNGLGQYPKPVTPDFDYVTYNLYLEGHAAIGNSNAASEMKKMENVKDALKINLPENGTYVVITTKSSFEDAVRENAKIFQTQVDIDAVAGPTQPAKYLKATYTGYELTDNKAEAAVFFFDGQHLTGLDNGFGLGESKYDLTANAQKAVIAQGKLEKTLDAGSYSLKVGDKFVKLDRDAGLSVVDNESDSHIFLEEATKFKLTTNPIGYVSFYAPTAVKVPAGVKIFSGKLTTNGTQVVFKDVSGNQIPANTAVLLKSTSQSTFEVEKIATAGTTITNNSLKGYTVSSSDYKNNAYGIALENGKLVFKRLSDGVRAFRAVVYKDAAAGTQEFIPTSFAPTGIEGVTVEKNKEEVFDLTGRRVESPVKGQVYVKSGKKFIQK